MVLLARGSVFTLKVAGLLAGLLSVPLAAQIPPGWGVSVAFSDPSTPMTMFSPRNDGPAVVITGLPAGLLATRGPNAVAILADGSIAVGSYSSVGSDVVIYTLQLRGTAVVASKRVFVGRSAGPAGSVVQIQALPDGDALFAVTQLEAGGPMAGNTVAVLSPAAGVITPIAITGLPVSGSNALAVSDDASEIFLGYWFSSSSGAIYRVPVNTRVATPVANTPHGVTGLDAAGPAGLFVVMNNARGGGLAYLDLGQGTLTQVPGTPRNPNAVAVERATGHVVYLDGRSATLVTASQGTRIASFANGVLAGLDLSESPLQYGDGSSGAASYTWDMRPGTGGLPTVGNASFEIAFRSSAAAPRAALMLLSSRRADQTVGGVRLLIDATAAAIVPLAVTGPFVRLPLPIPSDPALAGLALHAQTLVSEGGGRLATTAGLSIFIVQP